MKGKRYSEEQIVRILKEVEKGKPVADVCREHGVSEQSVYRWRTKFAGIDASDVESAPFTWLAIDFVNPKIPGTRLFPPMSNGSGSRNGLRM